MNGVIRSLAILISEVFPFGKGVLEFISGRTAIGFVYFAIDALKYSVINKTLFKVSGLEFYPCVVDRFDRAGKIPRHYFLQDIWAAKKVFMSGERVHYDVASRLDGFISHCLVFCEVVMLDVRPLPRSIQNLEFIEADFTHGVALPDNSIHSISALHSIEHFGLGRYGDPIDPMGHIRAVNEIIRLTAPGGNIYLSVPIGRRRLVFNAHRIFDPKDIPALFSGCELVDFSAIDDNDVFLPYPRLDDLSTLSYGCGLFHFRKNGLT